MLDDLWFKNAIVYSVDVETFMDGNGDGYGDFEGLTRRLDYLAGLGVTCLWLLPFFPSQRRDGGYDVDDYYGVDPRYGSLGDFVDFTREARSRGIRVIIDLVVNHTADTHPWFQSARSDPKSPFRDWYVWADEKPPDADEGMVFPGVQKTTWTRDPVAKKYYFHRFYKFQPDLDTGNPKVKEEIGKIMGFWLAVGVDGFRLDALPFVIQQKGADVEHCERFDDLREYRELVQWRRGDAVMLAEANVLPKDDLEYFGDDGDRVHMMFNFQANQNVFYALASGDTRPLQKALEKTRQRPPNAQWAQFLRNHDELDLGRLTEEQRQLVFDTFAPEEGMRLYGRGIRRRLAPMLGGDRRRLELAYSLMFTLPGTPVLRYGDEIGMGEDLSQKERLAARTPMQWSGERNGGFSLAEETVRPVVSEGPFAYGRVNVAHQRREAHSLLNWTERMIRMRKECPEIGWGEFEVLDTGDPAVLAIRYHWRGNAMITVHNVAAETKEVKIAADHDTLVNLLAHEHSEPGDDGLHTLDLPPYGYAWYRVGGLNQALMRDPIDTVTPTRKKS